LFLQKLWIWILIRSLLFHLHLHRHPLLKTNVISVIRVSFILKPRFIGKQRRSV
jgi:hypothetical protein